MIKEKDKMLVATAKLSEKRDDLMTEVNEASELRHCIFLHSQHDWKYHCDTYAGSIEMLKSTCQGLEDQLDCLTPRPDMHDRTIQSDGPTSTSLKGLMEHFKTVSAEINEI